MRKIIIGTGALLLLAGGLLFSLAPDTLSMLVLAVMCFITFLGFAMGLFPAMMYSFGFKTGRHNIEQTLDVQSTENWIGVFKLEYLFRQKTLDELFRSYKAKAEAQKEQEEIVSGIEEYISEDVLSLRTWQGLILQIPGALTGLGILGTFIGLITGISGIGFSSVDAALESVSVLLGGIKTAFYTSISGVILSILFNILYRMIWNTMLREYGMFIDSFHKFVIPSVEEQSRKKQDADIKKILSRLDRIPKNPGYSLSAPGGQAVTGGSANEQLLMPQIREGLKKGEFTFYLQPRVDINTRKFAAAEALVRWNHPTLGVLQPGSFLPVLEKNGFITKLDAYVWESVCKTIRKWIDAGIRPVPVSVNLSKTDIMAIDIVGFFRQMLEKYRIPPRALELEIAKNAYTQSEETTVEVAGELRRLGFKVIMDGFDGDYISVNMLENMETDALKLDLRFLAEDKDNEIASYFEQARKLNIELMAEGIENTEQITNLKKAGCVYGQGYYFYKPMSIEAFETATEQE
ncbi:EAL domain-containing protein [Blautia sp. MSJ-9]|uniref:EAL domain-containing protein n=1 Tax=Blautia sp. MSJ-9 TaxID=2841511 RepID=UPI001C106CC9|nr:EAL domain-containing protein [Blautia sp. MSJ-9]MBU5679473.1 EAL domain-containing protein [Blautia sp. MSJ-9]